VKFQRLGHVKKAQVREAKSSGVSKSPLMIRPKVRNPVSRVRKLPNPLVRNIKVKARWRFERLGQD
jgi:hypothetical protein